MSIWGSFESRFGSEKPVRRLLALDGGGIRGVLTLEVLLELEKQFRAAHGDPGLLLCDCFDYIAGTSTGAIIAAGLTLGMSVQSLLDFYESAGPLMFKKEFVLRRLQSLYKSGPLSLKLKETYGLDTLLGSDSLRTLLLVVTRNASTDSAWPISNNPLAKYNDRTRPDCNLQIPLWQLVRASTSAPVFFPPEVLQWDKNDPDKSFLFQDGGVTPYNNPAFLLYRMATLTPYRLKWPANESRMMLVSVGTGSAPSIDWNVLSPDRFVLGTLKDLPGALMNGAKADQDIACRTVGRCVAGLPIDREIGDLIPLDTITTDLGRAFVYGRYDADLTEKGLEQMGLADIDPGRVQTLDAIDAIGDLRRVGRAVARRLDLSAFGPIVTR
jgi:hypothetical protein